MMPGGLVPGGPPGHPGHFVQIGGQMQFQQVSGMTMPSSHMGAPIGQIPRQVAAPQGGPVGYPGGSSSHLGAQLGPGRNPSGFTAGGVFRPRGDSDMNGGGTPVGGGSSHGRVPGGVERHSFGISVNDQNQFAASLASLESRSYASRELHPQAGRDAPSMPSAVSSSRPQASYLGAGQAEEGGTDGGLMRESSFNPVSNAIPCRVLVRDPRTGAFVPSTQTSADHEADHTPAPTVAATRQPSQAPPIVTSVQEARRQREEADVLKEPQKVSPPPSAPKKKYVRPHLPNTVPTKEGVEHLEPDEVFELLKTEACMLVDVRGSDRSAGLIDGAVHVPAIDKVMFPARVPDLIRCFAQEGLVVFTCQYSAHRAPQCANWYREKAPGSQRVAILSGGFRAWEANGLPVTMPSSTKDEDKAADVFAMKQGVAFVKKHAPEVYQRAQQQRKESKEQEEVYDRPEQHEQHRQPQHTPKFKGERSERPERADRPDRPERNERSRTSHDHSDRRGHDHSERSEKTKADHGKALDEHSQQSTQRAHQKSQQQQQTLQLQQQQQQLRQQLQQLQQQQQRQLERQQQQLLQQQRLQTHLQQQSEGMQGPSAPSAQTRMPHRQPESNRGHPSNTVPIIDGVEILDPTDVYNFLYNEECVLVDVRGDDRAAGLIAGAYHVPAIGEPMFPTRLPDLLRAFANEGLVVFTCQYCAHRGPQCANWYREQANPRQRVAVLAGGFRGWEAAGLPVAAPIANPNEAAVSTPGNPNEGVPPDTYAMQQGLEFAQVVARQSGHVR